MRAACAAREPTKSDPSKSFPVSATFARGEADVSLSSLLKESRANVSIAALNAFLKRKLSRDF